MKSGCASNAMRPNVAIGNGIQIAHRNEGRRDETKTKHEFMRIVKRFNESKS